MGWINYGSGWKSEVPTKSLQVVEDQMDDRPLTVGLDEWIVERDPHMVTDAEDKVDEDDEKG